MHRVSLWNSRFSIKVMLVMALMVFTSSCKDDDDAPPPVNPEAPVSFTLSGAIQGDRSGSAIVSQSEVNGAHRLVFTFSDVDAQGEGGSFNLSFEQGPDNSVIDFPAPGTYSLGGLIQDEDFGVVFSDIGSNTTFLGEGDGNLVITASGTQYVEGTFEFGIATLTNPDNVLTASNGRFKALVQN